MKKLALAALVLWSFSIYAAAPADCTVCGGVITDLAWPSDAVVPLLVRVPFGRLAETGARLDSLSAEQRSRVTVLIEASLDPEKEPTAQAEQRIADILAWARPRGPFSSIGISLPHQPPEVEAYAIKRLAVTTQGLGIAEQIAFGPATLERLGTLFENGAQAYFDELVVEGDVAPAARWLAEHDPAKQIVAVVSIEHPNPIYDLARAFASGARRAFAPAADAAQSIAALNRELASDYTFDRNVVIEMLDARGNPLDGKPLAFVRGEDLRTLVVPPGHATESTIVTVRGDEFVGPKRIDASGSRPITDTGKKGGRTLVGIPPGRAGFAITLDRPKIDDPRVTRQAIDVVTERSITVEEIIRNHQAWRAFQDSLRTRYIARNATSLRFGLGPGGDSIETTIAGDFFFDPPSRSDWVWEDFLINGVKWRYGRIPEIPILQPEKVTQLPLDLHLTKDYRYELVQKGSLRGYETYEVRFEPPANAPPELPLYRGTVWIETRTWARVRMAAVQLNLQGEVLSNEERTDFHPFERAGGRLLTTIEAQQRDASALVWLPVEIAAQQTFSVAGAAVPVIRSTRLSEVQINPEDFESRLQMANQSPARMVRETDGGLKYLERNAQGERVVQEGEDTSRMFLLGGLHRDAGLEFGFIPLGGIDYFNYDLGGRGLQTNVFFAGVFVAANLTDPSYRGTRTNLGADFFGIAIPFENTSYRDGKEVEEEAVGALPFTLNLRAGHPLFDFAKIDAQLGMSYISYQQVETTADDYTIPENTFELRPSVDLRYDRWGYTFRVGYERGFRTGWEPWGDLSGFDQDQEQFSRYTATLGKNIYLPRFQRLGIELDYLDGDNLDRFSKYELGYFGSQRVRGIQSGSVRAERAVLGHLSYGFVLSDFFRMEAFYDHALVDDAAAGFSREPFQGFGIGGQTVGPWGTILRLDIGKSVGRNAQDEIVANVVLLKLFG